MTGGLTPPYLLTREEWQQEYERGRPDGNSSHKYSKGCGGALVAHINKLESLSFGVHQWLFNKALQGCSDSLFKLEYGYDLYSEVINKAIEENKL